MLLYNVIIEVTCLKYLEASRAFHSDCLICHSLASFKKCELHLSDLLHNHLAFLHWDIRQT